MVGGLTNVDGLIWEPIKHFLVCKFKPPLNAGLPWVLRRWCVQPIL